MEVQLSDVFAVVALIISIIALADTRLSRQREREIQAIRFINEVANFAAEQEGYVRESKAVTTDIMDRQISETGKAAIQKSLDAHDIMLKSAKISKKSVEAAYTVPRKALVKILPDLYVAYGQMQSSRKDFEYGVSALAKTDAQWTEKLEQLKRQYGASMVARSVEQAAALLDLRNERSTDAE